MLSPFGEKYHKNGGAGRGSEACAHCGKVVKEPWRWFIEVIHGGAYVRRDHDPEVVESARCDGASYMGCFPVGPDCRKVLEADGVRVERWDVEAGVKPAVNNEVV